MIFPGISLQSVIFPDDYEGNAFSKETDISNTGIVYYIYEGGNYDGNAASVDETEYQKLLGETYGGMDTVQVDFLAITPEHINKI